MIVLDLLDYDPMDPSKKDTYAFNPDTYLLNTEVAIWTILYSQHKRAYNKVGSETGFRLMEDALNVDARQMASDSESSSEEVEMENDHEEDQTCSEFEESKDSVDGILSSHDGAERSDTCRHLDVTISQFKI